MRLEDHPNELREIWLSAQRSKSWLQVKFIILAFLFFILMTMLFCSCKKTAPFIEGKEDNLEKQAILNNLDSIYLYAKQIYLWNEQLPSQERFIPGRFYEANADELKAYKQEIFEFSRFPMNSLTGKPYEYNTLESSLPKYSTIVKNAASGAKANMAESSGYKINSGFGLSFHHSALGTRILYVDLNSPAGKSGLKRGDRVTAINGQGFDNETAFSALWKTALSQSFIKLNTIDRNGKPREVRLLDGIFEINPVLKHQLINVGEKKIGYIAYSSFTDEANSEKYLEPVLTSFGHAGVSELIVDLRYNGGGYQNAVVYFANQLVPAKWDQKLMLTEHYNQTMRDGRAEMLRHQILRGGDNTPIYIDGRVATLNDIDYSVKANTVLFEKQGQLRDLKTIHFIISEYTASASELLINVLKPYLNVKLIGASTQGLQQVRSYGKPVGFFDIDINKYKMFISMYQLRNAIGEGDYFDGLAADLSSVDDPSYDFGMIDDPVIALALQNNVLARRQSAVKEALEPGKYIFSSPPADGVLKKSAADFVFKKSRAKGF